MGPPELTGGEEFLDLELVPEAVASMGPPELTGGEMPCLRAGDRRTRRFNGAAGTNRRRAVGVPRIQICTLSLQWGRRN